MGWIWGFFGQKFRIFSVRILGFFGAIWGFGGWKFGGFGGSNLGSFGSEIWVFLGWDLGCGFWGEFTGFGVRNRAFWGCFGGGNLWVFWDGNLGFFGQIWGLLGLKFWGFLGWDLRCGFWGELGGFGVSLTQGSWMPAWPYWTGAGCPTAPGGTP